MITTITAAFTWLTKTMPLVVAVLKAALAIGMTLEVLLNTLGSQFSALSTATRVMVTA